LDFQVNHQTYFLDLSENERQWLVFVATPNGPRGIPVYVDDPESQELTFVVEDRKKRQIPN
jgi:hypothetical protein